MKYYSTNRQSAAVDFKEATIKGQAPDKGLYFPEEIPVLPESFLKNLDRHSKEEIAFHAIRPYVGESIPDDELMRIVSETVYFDFPLVRVTDDIYSLELFHGPTLAFKDVGARFMSRCLGYFSRERSEKIIVLVATSGDTGGAVASGFHGVEGVEVVILYPSGKVSSVQEKQLTSFGSNVHALEINGTFDDCQRMVKQAFTDASLNEKLFLTSANSINVARWLPQQFYYFFAWQQWNDKSNAPVVSVPSGNFGNLCAGLVAWRSGLPLKHFVAACNANDVVPEFFQSGKFNPRAAIATISNAMDVGNPSNFVRMLELIGDSPEKLSKLISSYTITDDETKKAMDRVLKEDNYLLDPHGAVALLGLERYTQEHGKQPGIFMETAHPVKFYDVVEPVIGRKVEIPESIAGIMDKKKVSVKMEADDASLKQFLLQL
jgi:threonine synthase